MTPQTVAWLRERTEILPTGEEVRIEYDSEGDTLEIFFAAGSATGIELTDEIVLRYDTTSALPRSLIFTSFSHLIQGTEYGPESFRMTGIEALPPKHRDDVLRILRMLPVSYFLQLSAVKLPQSPQPIPFTSVRHLPLAA
ncbi:MAG: hypothetical protein KJZ86_15370 [Caldilineaceae bacterium]|nr:hypothetical protein [Caldilineaceae bacterium]